MSMANQAQTDQVVEYLLEKYAPLSLIVYGSFADGSQDDTSDFDALVICEDHARYHDQSVVAGIQLDVFVYPRREIEQVTDCEEFVQVFDGIVKMDTGNVGQSLKQKVVDYLHSQPMKSLDELHSDVQWCRKMALRAGRGDAEGMFRWHWVLIDSLQIFCGLVKLPYRGPKKSLRQMRLHDPAAYTCYLEALSSPDLAALNRWIDCLDDRLRAQ